MNLAIKDSKHDVKVESVAISSQDQEVWLGTRPTYSVTFQRIPATVDERNPKHHPTRANMYEHL